MLVMTCGVDYYDAFCSLICLIFPIYSGNEFFRIHIYPPYKYITSLVRLLLTPVTSYNNLVFNALKRTNNRVNKFLEIMCLCMSNASFPVSLTRAQHYLDQL